MPPPRAVAGLVASSQLSTGIGCLAGWLAQGSLGEDASQQLLETVNLDIEGTLDRLDLDLDKMLANVRAKAAADGGGGGAALPRQQPFNAATGGLSEEALAAAVRRPRVHRHLLPDWSLCVAVAAGISVCHGD